MQSFTDLAPHVSGNELAIYAVGAALILIILFKIPYVGSVLRGLFSFALLAFGIFLVLQQAPFDPNLSRITASLGLDRQEVVGDEVRIKQAFLNMELIAKSEGASLRDAVRLVVYVTDMFRFRPIVNKVQSELWGEGPFPPRTIVEVQRLNQDDIVEVEGTFYAPKGAK